MLWIALAAGIELSALGDLEGRVHIAYEALLEGRALVLQLTSDASQVGREQARIYAQLAPTWKARGIDFFTVCQTQGPADSGPLRDWKALALPFPVLLTQETASEQATVTLCIGRDGQLLAAHEGMQRDLTAALEQLSASKAADPAPLTDHLFEGPWRDEREGWLIQFERKDAAIWFRAEEMTRWDRPTQPGTVAEGAVQIALPVVRLNGTVFYFDERARNLLDPLDLSHRIVPGARPRLPVIDGAALLGEVELATALKHADRVVRRETVYHSVRGIQRQEIGALVEPWSLLEDSDAWTRASSAWAAGELGRADLLPKLERLLQDKSAVVRREAVRALGKLGWDAKSPALVRLAREDLDPLVRQLAQNPPQPPPPRPAEPEEER